jgi:Uma2 family endonuclease
VREYIVWRVYERDLDWLVLNDKGEYESLAADAGGILRSRVFPGLHLAKAALLGGDMAKVLETLHLSMPRPAAGLAR